MKKGVGYIYQVEGHTYVLDPEVIISKERIRVTGCAIFNMQLEYLGYWDRFNMPVELINGLTRWYKTERAEEIVARRTAMFKKEAKPGRSWDKGR